MATTLVTPASLSLPPVTGIVDRSGCGARQHLAVTVLTEWGGLSTWGYSIITNVKPVVLPGLDS